MEPHLAAFDLERWLRRHQSEARWSIGGSGAPQASLELSVVENTLAALIGPGLVATGLVPYALLQKRRAIRAAASTRNPETRDAPP